MNFEIRQINCNNIPSQQFVTSLEGYDVTFRIRQLHNFISMDIWIDNSPILYGIKCVSNRNLLTYKKQPLQGKIMFYDKYGNEEPYYTGLNNRWLLLYVK